MSDTFDLDIQHLRIGLHVQLDLGWMAHPFPLNSFRLASAEQIETLRGLGLRQVRVVASRSLPAALHALVDEGVIDAGQAPPREPAPRAVAVAAVRPQPPDPAEEERQRRRAQQAAEQECLAQAERAYAEAGRGLRRCFELVRSQPQAAREQCEAQVRDYLDLVLGAQEMAIRLLGEGAGDRASMHAINVTVISLLLGKALGLPEEAMQELGVGAMLHDVGKLDLPERVRWLDPTTALVSVHERQYYQEHVALGVVVGKQMTLSPGALLVLAQHHELADGNGFPLKLAGERISLPARIVALVNRYDNLCNPASPAHAHTPHEALSLMYAQMKPQFDAAVFAAFVRMMGVYPPGSVVQLSDDRYALVTTVNSSRPLKPRVLVHEPRAGRDTASSVDLEQAPGLSIRRSLKPQHLPRAALDALSPRPRVCYFFERARELEFTASATDARARKEVA
ncbi:HD-GYP domain-containing protein [Caldimonas sp. KR1-144]|uniref:HD-GYP domain-containing protein n=1 Tax=Caldimonas sp. KR1-144 TaxID=3400911 RepID=UPI003C031A5B